MKFFFGVLAIVLGLSPFAHAQGSLGIDIRLSPAGSFKVETTKVKGTAYRVGDGVEADNIIIDMKTISSGIGLRDKHLKERLEVEKYPIAKVIKAKGQGGKGTAILEIKGQKQEVAGTYKVTGDSLEAKFKMKVSDLQIKDVRYMGVGVKDEVEVTIVVPVKANRSAASIKGR